MFNTVENDPSIVDPGILGFDDETSFVGFDFDDYPDEVFIRTDLPASQIKPRKVSGYLLSPDIIETKPHPTRKLSRSRSLDDVEMCCDRDILLAAMSVQRCPNQGKGSCCDQASCTDSDSTRPQNLEQK